ncbi:MAG: MBL fold metallo-hydrolase [Flavobacteriaceae bacterium]
MKKISWSFFLMIFSLAQYAVFCQDNQVVIKIDSLSKDVYMLTGRGGNIGIYIGTHHVFMIDDQFDRLSDKIKGTISTLTNKPISFLLNTHMHGDHTGGNAKFNVPNTTIVAHENVRERVKTNQAKKLEKGEINMEYFNKMLPELTYSDHITFYDGDEIIRAFHVLNAHTDGDTMVFFEKNNVLHMGDTYFAGRYPYIDLNSGGSVDGYIKAHKTALSVIDDNTVIIPGHGRPSSKEALQSYIRMLEDIKLKMEAAILAGKSLEEVKDDTSISGNYDATHGSGYIDPIQLRTTFYNSLKE